MTAVFEKHVKTALDPVDLFGLPYHSNMHVVIYGVAQIFDSSDNFLHESEECRGGNDLFLFPVVAISLEGNSANRCGMAVDQICFLLRRLVHHPETMA